MRYGLWWLGEGLLLLQIGLALRGRYLSKYPVFYSYLCYLLLQGLLGTYIYGVRPSYYLGFYWSAELLSVAGGYCVLWEVYNQVLKDYVGTAKMAHILVSAVFCTIAGKFVLGVLTDRGIGFPKLVIPLERDLRAVQAILLIVLLALIIYYGIPIGRNLRGLIIGYGFAITTGMVLLTLGPYVGAKFKLWWQDAQQVCSLTTLFIWACALWSYYPNPRPEREIEIERDYEFISSRTALAVAKARGYLVRAVRS